MAAEVGSLNASLTLDLSEFKAGMAEAAALAQQLAAQLKSAFSSDIGLKRMLADIRELQQQLELLRGTLSELQASANRTTGAQLFASMREHTAGMGQNLAAVRGSLEGLLAPASQLRSLLQSSSAHAGNLASKLQGLKMPTLGSGNLDFSAAVAQLQQLTGLATQLVTMLQSLGAVDMNTGELVGGDSLSALYAVATNIQDMNAQVAGIVTQFKELNSVTASWLTQLAQADQILDSIALDVQRANANMRSLQIGADAVTNESKDTATQTKQVAKNLQTSKGYAVSLKGILGGIVVAQSFYTLLNIMEDLVRGAITFSETMQDAGVAFKYLMQDAEVTSDSFLNAMRDISLMASLDVTDLTSASRKLMAMGFSAKATVPALQILTDTAAVFSNNAGDMAYMIDHIALAFGQMIAAGKVSSQEMRQLYNAGLPIYELMSEGLGISMEMAKNIGHYNIDSATAVYATLLQLQERYGGAAEELSMTIAGSLEVIREAFQQLLASSWQGVIPQITQFLNQLARQLQALLKITEAYGLGGLFQALFPPSTWQDLRLVVGAIGQIIQALQILGSIVVDVAGTALRMLLSIGAVVLPIIGTIVSTIASLAKAAITAFPWIKNLLAAIMLLTVAGLIAKFVTLLAKALYLLTGAAAAAKAIALLVKSMVAAVAAHPALTLALLAIAAAFLAIVASSEKARAAIARFFGGISNSFREFGDSLQIGFDPNDVLMPEFQKPDTDDFVAGLEDMTNGMTDLEDATDSAGDSAKKAKKNLQSFDEVYTIDDEDDPASGTANSIMDIWKALQDLGTLDYSDMFDWTGDWAQDWENLKVSLGGMDFGDDGDGSGLLPKIDFGKWAQEFWNKLVEACGGYANLFSLGIGGILGAIIGGLLGGPAGAVIGAALGTLAGGIWNMLAEKLNLTDAGQIALLLGAGLGGIIGGLIGGPGGALIGAGIGILIGWCVEAVAKAIETGDWSQVAYPFAIGIGAGIGFIFGGPAGAVIGGAIGLLIATLIEILMDCIEAENWPGVGTVIGTGIGAAIGFIAGGPIGAVIGAGIGALVGWLIGNLVTAVQEEDWPTVGATLGGGIGAAIGLVVGGPVGALIGAAIGTVGGWIVGKFAELDWAGIGEAAKNLISGLIEGLKKAAEDVWTWIQNFGKDFIDALKKVFGIASPAKEMKPLGSYIIQGMEVGLEDEAGDIDTFLDSVLRQPFMDWFQSIFAADFFKMFGGNMVMGLQMGSDEYMEGMPDWLNSYVASPIFKNMELLFALSNFTSFGENIIEGMMIGLENMRPAIMAQVAAICNEIRSRIQMALDMHSPSKFTEWAGEMLMKGMQVGLLENAGMALLAAQKVSEQLADVLSTRMSAATAQMADMPAQFTARITPLAVADQMRSESTTGTPMTSTITATLSEISIAALSSSIADRIYEYLAPLFATLTAEDQDRVIAYIGTLVADDAGLKALERKLYSIRQAESGRRIGG